MNYLFHLYILLLLLLSGEISAQNRTVSLTKNNLLIKDALAEIQKKSGFRILYNDEVIPENLKVSINGKNLPIEKVFEMMFANTNLTYVMHSENLIVITDKRFLMNNSDYFGNVSDDTKNSVSFANVLLFKGKDDRPAYSAVTDLNGNFQILQVTHGEYRLMISFIGYESIEKPFVINANLKESYILKSKPELLSTVVVNGEGTRTSPNKLTYVILPKDLIGAKSALDLVKKVPAIYIDPVNEKIKSNDGEKIKLLLNGTNATEIDFKSLRPNDILRMEYYDIPPARYAEYKTVINLITKKREDGFATGADVNHALTTGFWNDQVYFKYNHGKHQFSFDFAQYHRNYKNRKYTHNYEYKFNHVDYLRNENGKDKFGYDDDHINFTYSNQEMDKYVFQAKFSPNYMNFHADGTKDIQSYTNDSLTNKTGSTWSRRNEFNPVLDIYYWKQLPNKQELAINLVGTIFNTSNKYLNEEFNTDRTLSLNDDMNQQNHKYSIIGEINYTRPLRIGNLCLGYNLEANTMNTKVLNSFNDTDYNTSYFQNYAYGEFSAQKDKWMYMARLGVANRNQTTYDQKRNDWIWKPQAMIGYSFSPSHSIKLIFDRDNGEPSLANLSNNRIYITDHIVRQGNPSLRISTTSEIYMRYNFNSTYVNMSLVTAYQYTQHPISSYFTEQEDYIVQMSENGQSSTVYGIIYSFSLNPFGSNFLSLKVEGKAIRNELNTTQIGIFGHNYFPLYYGATLQHKNWTLDYYGNIVSKSLSGPYFNADENNAHLTLKYVKNDWSVSTCWWWIGQPSKYATSTIPESIVQYKSTTQIYDNKNMFTFGVSYNFNKGKKFNEKQKKLENRDSDSGAF